MDTKIENVVMILHKRAGGRLDPLWAGCECSDIEEAIDWIAKKYYEDIDNEITRNVDKLFDIDTQEIQWNEEFAKAWARFREELKQSRTYTNDIHYYDLADCVHIEFCDSDGDVNEYISQDDYNDLEEICISWLANTTLKKKVENWMIEYLQNLEIDDKNIDAREISEEEKEKQLNEAIARTIARMYEYSH